MDSTMLSLMVARCCCRSSLNSIALIGGALRACPQSWLPHGVRVAQIDEPLRSATHEVLRLACTAFIRGEACFQAMSRSVDAFPAEVKDLLQKAARKCSYRIAVDGSSAELLSLAH